MERQLVPSEGSLEHSSLEEDEEVASGKSASLQSGVPSSDAQNMRNRGPCSCDPSVLKG